MSDAEIGYFTIGLDILRHIYIWLEHHFSSFQDTCPDRNCAIPKHIIKSDFLLHGAQIKND